MNTKTLRTEINAAHAAGNMVLAAELQAKLHAVTAAAAEQFVNSGKGQQWMNGYLMNRP